MEVYGQMVFIIICISINLFAHINTCHVFPHSSNDSNLPEYIVMLPNWKYLWSKGSTQLSEYSINFTCTFSHTHTLQPTLNTFNFRKHWTNCLLFYKVKREKNTTASAYYFLFPFLFCLYKPAQQPSINCMTSSSCLMSLQEKGRPTTDSQLLAFPVSTSSVNMVMYSVCRTPKEKLGPVFLLIRTCKLI